jgi:signal transduction histidine kinase
VLTEAVVASGSLGVAWLRSGRRPPGPPLPPARRARLADLGWCAGLLGGAMTVTGGLAPAFYFGYSAADSGRPHGHYLETVVVLLAAALVVALRPRLASRLVPVALIAAGGYGFVAAKYWGTQDWPWETGKYGFLLMHSYSVQHFFILPAAYGLLLLGGWLLWRRTDRESPAAWLMFGRMAEPGRLRGLVLLPVAIAAAELAAPNIWFGSGHPGLLWTTAIALGAYAVAWWSPATAARLGTAGLIVLAIASLAVAGFWTAWPLPKPTDLAILDGLVSVSAQPLPDLALLQGAALIAVGLWLLPQEFPAARRWLGRASTADLARRVQRLTESRAVAVDTAAADLRRLERDLHDGAQARLVALGMHLRAVERLIPTSPDAAIALVAEARETSARALTELRELVRGVHPPVLADRGLGDAIRALALDAPLRVETEVCLPGRLPAPVETACYFAVAEVLTNVAKHSGAREARISVTHADGRLQITVTDFGLGGADPSRGSGLAGIEKRLAAFDGILAVSSPVGGPTMVVMEVPCASPAEQVPAR